MLTDGRIGLGLCAAGAALVAVAAADEPGSRPGPVLALLAAAAAAGILGWAAARAAPWLAPLAVTIGVAAAVVPFLPEAGEPTAAPLGYANANGTLFAIGALAGAALAGDRRGPVGVRLVGAAGAVVLAAFTLAAGSIAGLAVLLAAGVVAAVALVRPPVAAVGAGLALVAFLVATVGVAALGRGHPEGGDLSVRAALWHDAYEIAVEHPLTGVGPGRYEVVRQATDDADLRWAHHGPLQVAAELGGVAAGTLVLAVGWALARGGASSGAAAAAALAAVAALAAHACFDYVLHEGVLAVAVAFLVGAARPRRRRQRQSGAHPG